MISQDQAEAASEWIRDNAEQFGVLRSQRKNLERYTKVIYGELYGKAPDGTQKDKDAWVTAQSMYRENLNAIHIAEQEEIKLEWLYEAAKSRIELWRSLEASRRAG